MARRSSSSPRGSRSFSRASPARRSPSKPPAKVASQKNDVSKNTPKSAPPAQQTGSLFGNTIGDMFRSFSVLTMV